MKHNTSKLSFSPSSSSATIQHSRTSYIIYSLTFLTRRQLDETTTLCIVPVRFAQLHPFLQVLSGINYRYVCPLLAQCSTHRALCPPVIRPTPNVCIVTRWRYIPEANTVLLCMLFCVSFLICEERCWWVTNPEQVLSFTSNCEKHMGRIMDDGRWGYDAITSDKVQVAYGAYTWGFNLRCFIAQTVFK